MCSSCPRRHLLLLSTRWGHTDGGLLGITLIPFPLPDHRPGSELAHFDPVLHHTAIFAVGGAAHGAALGTVRGGLVLTEVGGI